MIATQVEWWRNMQVNRHEPYLKSRKIYRLRFNYESVLFLGNKQFTI